MSDPRAGDPATARVLHIDDEPDFAELAAEFMRRQDEALDIETETDPAAALTRLRNGDRFDCVVSDYDMPELSGLDLLRTIREVKPDLPFILFTGKGSEEVAADAISAGVTDYLQKEGGTDQYAILVNRIRNAVERRRAREAVEETEIWARTLLTHSSDFLFVVDGIGEISYVSPSIQRVMGYVPDEVRSANAFDFIHPEDLPIAEEAFTEALESPGEAVTVEYRAVDADGDTRWLEVRGRNLLEDPVIEGVLVNARDVTDRHRSEQERRDAERRYRALLESSDDAIARNHVRRGDPRGPGVQRGVRVAVRPRGRGGDGAGHRRPGGRRRPARGGPGAQPPGPSRRGDERPAAPGHARGAGGVRLAGRADRAARRRPGRVGVRDLHPDHRRPPGRPVALTCKVPG